MKKLCAMLCAVTLLSACTSLPTEGPVNATRAPDGTNQTVGFYANGPREGSTPEEIVYGFLTASAAGLSDDFEVARQFLSPQASEDWRPLEEVRIYADARVPVTTRTETQAVRLSLGAEGSIDPSGRFMMSSSDAVITTDFSLARNADGEWRIIDLDNGLLISATLFESQYSKSELYFLTADSQYLVADLRWFPRTSYASAATRELFEGPSEWLSDGVFTAVPPGTTIGNRGISTTSGTATVSLSDEALSVSEYQRALFMAQIEETLTVLSNIQNVELTVDGVPWESNQSINLSSYPFTESTMLVNVDGRPSLYENGSAVSLTMTNVPADLEALAIGYGDNPPMVAIADGSRLVTLSNEGSAPVTLLEGDTIGTPSIDIYDWIWAGSGDAIIAFTADGDRVPLSASWLDGGTVDSIHVSREGARAVVVWHNATNTYMTTTAIIRDGNGEPVALDGVLDLGAGVEQILDVAWIDETTVAVLATLPGGSNPGIYAVPIGGPITPITEVNGATSITAGSGQGSLVLATENGQILERSGGGWRLLLTHGSSPALPG